MHTVTDFEFAADHARVSHVTLSFPIAQIMKLRHSGTVRNYVLSSIPIPAPPLAPSVPTRLSSTLSRQPHALSSAPHLTRLVPS